MARLGISQVPGSNPAQFLVRNLETQQSAPAAVVPSPYEWPVPNAGDEKLMAQLRWLLETFLSYPFEPYTTRAKQIEDALKAWGTAAFEALFDNLAAGKWISQQAGATVEFFVTCDDPQFLAWPWEALHDPAMGYFGHRAQIQRRLSAEIPDAPAPSSQIALLILALTEYARWPGTLGDAAPLSERLVELVAQTGEPQIEARSLQRLAIIARKRKAFAEAERWYLQLAALFKRQGNKEDSASALHQLGELAEERHEFAAADRWYLEELASKEREPSERSKANLYHHLGMAAETRHDHVAANHWLTTSLAILEKLGDEKGAALTCYYLGKVTENRWDFAGAKRWFLQALAYWEKEGDEANAANAYQALGLIAEDEEDFSTAEQWHRKSLAIREKLGDEAGAASLYQAFGNAAQERQDSAEAERWHVKALGLFEKHGNEHGAADARHQLSWLALARGDHHRSGTYLLDAYRGYIASGDGVLASMMEASFINLLRKSPAETRTALVAEARAVLRPEAMAEVVGVASED